MNRIITYICTLILLTGCKTIEVPSIKSGVRSSGKNSLYFENNKDGRTIFAKNDGMNGPITMISATEYDRSGREIKSYWVHSNIGFFLDDIEYEEKQIRKYSYLSKTDTLFPFDRNTLREINSRSEFINMEGFVYLKNGNRHLSRIENLDSAKNVIEELYLSESGDTTSFNLYKYNSKNQEISFHKRDPHSKVWNWDIFKIYDDNSNLIHSFRISGGSMKDTTEKYNYLYDGNLLESRNYYHRSRFQNKTIFKYNSKGQVIEELFYEDDETSIKVRTKIKYDKRGNRSEEFEKDYRKPKDEQISKTKFVYEYE